MLLQLPKPLPPMQFATMPTLFTRKVLHRKPSVTRLTVSTLLGVGDTVMDFRELLGVSWLRLCPDRKRSHGAFRKQTDRTPYIIET